MQRLCKLKESFLKLLTQIRRYPNELRMDSINGEFEVDNMIISGPKHTYFYFRFEYILSLLFSITVIAMTIFFLAKDEDLSSSDQKFTLLKYWLRIGIILHICSLVPKSLILRRLLKIPLENERLIIRRLMTLVRSNVFFWNDKVSFVMYNYYIFGMGKLASSNVCGSMASNLYRMCHFIIGCFLLRLANLFVRFFMEYYIFTRNVEHGSILGQGASQEEIEGLTTSVFSEEDSSEKIKQEFEETQCCGICRCQFKNGDEIRTLPCSRQHFFHKKCIDPWLRQQYLCPYCRKSLRLLAPQY